MDIHLNAWCNTLSAGEREAWDNRDKINFDKSITDKLGTPKAHMKSHGVFDPSPNAHHRLCRFYKVGSKSSLPSHVPNSQKTVTRCLLLCLLKKGRKANRPYLLVVTPQDVISPSGLLGELHAPGSLHHLPMHVEGDPPEKHQTKLCFCPLCKYSVANDQSFLNHVMHAHYQANYGYGKCLGEVCGESQPMQHHLWECRGLPDTADSHSPQHQKSSSSAEKVAHKESHSRRCPESSAQGAEPGTSLKDMSKKGSKSSKHHVCS